MAKNKTNSSFLDSSIFSAFFCGTNIQIQCSSWHKKLQLFFGLLTRTNQTNWVSLGLFCLAGNTWTKIQCPFEGKDKLCLDWHKKLQLLFGFLFMRFLCHFCLARKIRQTWPLTFGRKITRRPFDGEQFKNVSLSVVGDFRHQLFFLTN